jgi:hypothetical protein
MKNGLVSENDKVSEEVFGKQDKNSYMKANGERRPK